MQRKIFRSMCLIAIVSSAASVLAVMLPERLGWQDGSSHIVMFIASVLAGILLSGVLTARIVSPIRRQNDDPAYEELSPLFRRIEDQRSQIRQGRDMLMEKERGLEMIMEYMTEGLVLLDFRGIIISINRSARKLLALPDDDFAGKHIFAAFSTESFQAAVLTATSGFSCEELVRRGDLHLQVMAGPVKVDETVRAVVLLLFDVTEKQETEKMRREFSANVSHELKTPLTSISGYAELLKNGMAADGDIRDFAGKIYDEAQRLIELVEDIMKLSQLDEGGRGMKREPVSLLEVSEDVANRLAGKAQEYGVTLEVQGEEAVVFGIRQMLDEMVYNLCDNAIKYNSPGGIVSIIVRLSGGVPVLSVKDTGIGIPREERGRVFERFYRVDKSHSKETGGTGLGLSIVKHGAAFHGATIEMDSTLGIGTVIRLRFAKTEL